MPTQIDHPLRDVLRTGVAVGTGLLSVIPENYSESIESTQVLLISTVLMFILDLPQVNAFVSKYIPALAAEPRKKVEADA